MSQAGRTRYFARSARRGDEKNLPLVSRSARNIAFALIGSLSASHAGYQLRIFLDISRLEKSIKSKWNWITLNRKLFLKSDLTLNYQ